MPADGRTVATKRPPCRHAYGKLKFDGTADLRRSVLGLLGTPMTQSWFAGTVVEYLTRRYAKFCHDAPVGLERAEFEFPLNQGELLTALMLRRILLSRTYLT